MKNKQRNLMSIRNDARAALTRRLHSRINWQPVHQTTNGGKGQNGLCSRCGGTVTVLTKPEPNETDIAGTAIGQDCNTLLQDPNRRKERLEDNYNKAAQTVCRLAKELDYPIKEVLVGITAGLKENGIRHQTMALVQLHFRTCGDGTVRVWRDHWFGDQFEVFTHTEFDQLRTCGERLTFQFIDHTDKD